MTVQQLLLLSLLIFIYQSQSIDYNHYSHDDSTVTNKLRITHMVSDISYATTLDQVLFTVLDYSGNILIEEEPPISSFSTRNTISTLLVDYDFDEYDIDEMKVHFRDDAIGDVNGALFTILQLHTHHRAFCFIYSGDDYGQLIDDDLPYILHNEGSECVDSSSTELVYGFYGYYAREIAIEEAIGRMRVIVNTWAYEIVNTLYVCVKSNGVYVDNIGLFSRTPTSVGNYHERLLHFVTNSDNDWPHVDTVEYIRGAEGCNENSGSTHCCEMAGKEVVWSINVDTPTLADIIDFTYNTIDSAFNKISLTQMGTDFENFYMLQDIISFTSRLRNTETGDYTDEIFYDYVHSLSENNVEIDYEFNNLEPNTLYELELKYVVEIFDVYNNREIAYENFDSKVNIPLKTGCNCVPGSSAAPELGYTQEFDIIIFSFKDNGACEDSWAGGLTNELNPDMTFTTGVCDSNTEYLETEFENDIVGDHQMYFWGIDASDNIIPASLNIHNSITFTRKWSSKLVLNAKNQDGVPVSGRIFNIFNTVEVASGFTNNDGTLELIFYVDTDLGSSHNFDFKYNDGLSFKVEGDDTVYSEYEITMERFTEYILNVEVTVEVATGNVFIEDYPSCPAIGVEICTNDGDICTKTNDEGIYYLTLSATSGTITSDVSTDTHDYDSETVSYNFDFAVGKTQYQVKLVDACDNPYTEEFELSLISTCSDLNMNINVMHDDMFDIYYSKYDLEITTMDGSPSKKIFGGDQYGVKSISTYDDSGIVEFVAYPDPIIDISSLMKECDSVYTIEPGIQIVDISVHRIGFDGNFCNLDLPSNLYLSDTVTKQGLCESECVFSLKNGTNQLEYQYSINPNVFEISKNPLRYLNISIDTFIGSEYSFDVSVPVYVLGNILHSKFTTYMPKSLSFFTGYESPPGRNSYSDIPIGTVLSLVHEVKEPQMKSINSKELTQTFEFTPMGEASLLSYVQTSAESSTISSSIGNEYTNGGGDSILVPDMTMFVELHHVSKMGNGTCDHEFDYLISWVPQLSSIKDFYSVHDIQENIDQVLYAAEIDTEASDADILEANIVAEYWNDILDIMENVVYDPVTITNFSVSNLLQVVYASDYENIDQDYVTFNGKRKQTFEVELSTNYTGYRSHISKIYIPDELVPEFEKWITLKTTVYGSTSRHYFEMHTDTTVSYSKGEEENTHFLISLREEIPNNSYEFSLGINPTTGLPTYKVFGGTSSCPNTEGTIPRIVGKIVVEDPDRLDQPAPVEASFKVTVSNSYGSGYQRYIFYPDFNSLNGLSIFLNGAPLEEKFIDLNEAENVVFDLVVSRIVGPYQYENIRLILESDCGDIISEAYLNVSFIQYCPPIEWAGSMASESDWYSNSISTGVLVSIKNPNFIEYALNDIYNEGRLLNINLEYLQDNSGEWQHVADLLDYEESDLGIIEYLWETAEKDDGNYDLRVTTVCTDILSEEYDTFTTSVSPGSIDFTPAQQFGAPFPSDIYKSGDPIGVHFTENLLCLKTPVYTFEAVVSETGDELKMFSVCEGRSIFLEFHATIFYDTMVGNSVTITLSGVQDMLWNPTSNISWSFSVEQIELPRTKTTLQKLAYNGDSIHFEDGDTSKASVEDNIASSLQIESDRVEISDVKFGENGTSTFSLNLNPEKSPTSSSITTTTLSKDFTDIVISGSDSDLSDIEVIDDSWIVVEELECDSFSGVFGCSDAIIGNQGAVVGLGVTLALVAIMCVVLLGITYRFYDQRKKSVAKLSQDIELKD
eukprot:TRINITY_DN1998_c0_g2_i1.p1 TRINITY_DN1998_c0_g2~~TRINITY_DN1998_c0_g2_i1.p1  ORF type:complete len:1759 (-),score=430.16 TRINITY_DN1998_c0_g2_i1:56-5332(-)